MISTFWLKLIKIQSNISEQEKKQQKKSMICFTPKPSPQNNWSFFYDLHQAQTLIPLITLYVAF